MKKIIVVLFFIVGSPLGAGMLDMFSLGGIKTLTEGSKSVDLPFFMDSIEIRKHQQEQLEKSLAELKTRSADLFQSIGKTLNQLKTESATIKNQMRGMTGVDAEYLGRKNVLLNERRQNILAMQELLRDREQVLEERIKQVASYIEALKVGQKEFEEKIAYTLKDLREFENKIAEVIERKTVLEGRKENLLRQKSVTQEKIASLKREVELREKEREKFPAQLAKAQEQDQVSNLKIKAELVDNELNYAKERQETMLLRLEKTVLEAEQLDDEFSHLKNKLDRLSYALTTIKKNLVIDAVDVEVAKTEWRKEARKSRIAIDQLNKTREFRLGFKEKIVQELASVNDKFKQHMAIGEEKSAEGVLFELMIQKLTHLQVACDYEINLIEFKRELIEATLEVKQLDTKSIVERYKVSRGHTTLDEWISTIGNKSRSFEMAIKTSRNKRDDVLAALTQISLTDELIRKKIEELKTNKDVLFKEKPKLYLDAQAILNDIKNSLMLQLNFIQQQIGILSALISRYESLFTQCSLFIKEFEARKLDVDIWSRSTYAISWLSLSRSFEDVDSFLRKVFWATPVFLSPIQGMKSIFGWAAGDYLGLLLFLLFFLIGYFGLRVFLLFSKRKLEPLMSAQNGRLAFLYLNLLDCLITFIIDHFYLMYVGFFFALQSIVPLHWFGAIIQGFTHTYFSAIYYLFMIPVALYLSTELLIDLKNLNQRLSFLLFSEQMQAKFLHLISFVLYSGAVLLPFRKAFLQYGTVNSELPAVLFAAFSLVVVVVLLLFFNREDLIRILPSQGYFFGWLKRKIELYYYPVFLFFMGLLILSNPYVGYVRLAWFLAFAFPTSLLFVMSCIFAHHYIRKFSLYFFMKDNEEDMVVRFENAKMYYGFFVVLSFIFVSLIGFLFIARIWGFAYTIPTLYKALSEDWVLKLADGGKLGFIEFLMAICFILTSFIASSLFQKYLLNRLFDIFRTEPGAQNTIVRMSHYLVVLVVLIIGFVAIGLSAYIKYLLTLLVIGVSLGLKDQIADFFAGLLVLLERQIEIGHYIQADNVQGTVEKIEARSTTIRTARNFSVIIPNRDLISKTIINWGRGRSSVGFELSLHVNFDTDPEKVKNALLEVIQAHPMVLRMPSVVVRLEDFDTLGQLFFVRAFISSRKLREQWEIASELRIAIIKAFQKINVQIPYPTNTLDISLPMVSKGGISVKFDQQE